MRPVEPATGVAEPQARRRWTLGEWWRFFAFAMMILLFLFYVFVLPFLKFP